MITIVIVYLSTLGLLTFLSCLWNTIQETLDCHLLTKTHKLLIQKDGLPKLHLTNKYNLKSLNVLNCQHPCRVHFPKETNFGKKSKTSQTDCLLLLNPRNCKVVA